MKMPSVHSVDDIEAAYQYTLSHSPVAMATWRQAVHLGCTDEQALKLQVAMLFRQCEEAAETLRHHLEEQRYFRMAFKEGSRIVKLTPPPVR